MSFAQQRLWFLDQVAPGNPFYNIPLVLPFAGRLDHRVLDRAVNEIVRRHEALRTTFRVVDGEPAQVVAPQLTITVEVIRMDGASPAVWERDLRRLATEEARRVFDLRRGPLVRASVVSRSATDHVILLTLHHIVADGWSVGVFIRELSALYQAFAARRPSPLPELTLQYADFAVWQREHLRGERLERLLAHWTARLADLPVLELPADRPRPRVLDYQGATVSIALSAELSDAIRQLAQRAQATPFMVLLAGFIGLLQRYTGQDDIAVGIPIANRTRAETEALIGFFVNSLLIRCDVSGRPTFAELVERVRDECLDAYTHQDLPFERLVEHLQPTRDLGRNPLFQVTFQLVNAPTLDRAGAAPVAPALEVQRGSAIFDVAVTLMDGDGPYGGVIEYSTQLFERATIERFAGHYRKLLAAVVADPTRRPDSVGLTTARERLALSTAVPTSTTPPRPVVASVRAACGRDASALAVRGPDGDLTAAQLLDRADTLAERLGAAGIGPGSRVALYLDHSAWTPVAMLAALASGAAYVPLDPDYPAERTALMLDDSRCDLVVAERDLAEQLAGRATMIVDDAPPARSSSYASTEPHHQPLDGAYVIYTSGSTGAPRGVEVPRLALDNHMEWMARAFPLTPDDRVLQRTSPCFDASVWEFFAPLMAGAQLVVLPRAARRDPSAIAAAILTNDITVVQVVPTLLRALLDEPDLLAATSLRRVFCGGEVLDLELRDRFHASCDAELVNLYGPTETTIDATSHISARGDRRPRVAIGRPVDGVTVHVLDDVGQPVPIGVPGRLHIGGDGVALGYLGHPAATAARFTPDPWATRPGARRYDTGDIVRFRTDGELEFLGRADSQLKIRGYRVEPVEIERTIERARGIGRCVVTAAVDAAGEQHLVGYLVPDHGADLAELVDEAEDDVVDRWHEVYGAVYATVAPGDDVELNTVGWNSSIDGTPLPAEAMAGWRDETVARIREVNHGAVLEIGCGTGMILGALAPHCHRYVATDFSASIIDFLASTVRSPGSPLAHVELHQRHADDLADFEHAGFDVVVVNSVVQYFPSVAYLRRVLEQAVRCVRPGGAVFVGDVRSLALLEAFHLHVELAHAGAGAPVEEVLDAVRRRAADEEELVVDPGFFAALTDELPIVERCDVRVKADPHDNEMTWFRFDAILRVAPDDRPEVGAQRLTWHPAMSAEALVDRLAAIDSDAIVVEGVPDRRLAPLLAMLQAGSDTGAQGGAGLTPPELTAVGRDNGWDVSLSPCSDRPGSIDATFVRGAARGARVTAPRVPDRGAPVTNDPLRAALTARVLPGVRSELARLPDHMAPTRFVVLDTLPRLPNGKLDRARLPDPFKAARRRTRYVAPATPLEELLADTFSEVTGVARVGTADDFFTELGGHSLLATRLVARLRTVLRCDVPLRLVFEATTVAELASALADSTAAGERMARIADHVERLPDAELAALLGGLDDGAIVGDLVGRWRADG